MKHLRLGQTRDQHRDYGGIGVPVELIGDLLCATADGIENICELMREMNGKLDRMTEAVETGTAKANESLEEAAKARGVIARAVAAVEKLSRVLAAVSLRSSSRKT